MRPMNLKQRTWRPPSETSSLSPSQRCVRSSRAYLSCYQSTASPLAEAASSLPVLHLSVSVRVRSRVHCLSAPVPASRVNVGLMEALVEIYYSDGETRKTNH